MWPLGKKNRKAALALPAPLPQNVDTAIDVAVEKDFARAAFGTHFRTRIFKQPYDLSEQPDTEWREANAVADGWVVRAMRHNVGPDGVVRKQVSILDKKPQTFINAVRSLATYEQAMAESGREAIESIAAMGFIHVRAFAEREGLVFDEVGQPHPTQRGLIVTDGHFALDAEVRALNAFTEKDRLRTDLINAKFTPIDPQKWQKLKIGVQALDLMLGDMQNLRSRIVEAGEKNTNSLQHFLTSILQGKKLSLSDTGEYRRAAFERLVGMHKEGYRHIPGFEDVAGPLCDSFLLHFFIGVAAKVENHIRSNTCKCEWDDQPIRCSHKHSNAFQALAADILRKHGFEQPEQLVYHATRAMTHTNSGKTTMMVPMLDSVISDVKRFQLALEASIQNAEAEMPQPQTALLAAPGRSP